MFLQKETFQFPYQYIGVNPCHEVSWELRTHTTFAGPGASVEIGSQSSMVGKKRKAGVVRVTKDPTLSWIKTEIWNDEGEEISVRPKKERKLVNSSEDVEGPITRIPAELVHCILSFLPHR